MTIPEKISTARDIINKHFKVSISEKSRKREVVMARQFYYKWIKENTNLSLGSMGKTLKLKQDHSSVIHAINTFDSLMFMYPKSYGLEWVSVKEKINKKIEQVQIREDEFSMAFNPS